ncbi:insulinase family protein [Lactobacillus kefiranofaciens]|uniref:Insulinase family protein n=1 Tax=Lactobacillus kefiranofaciens TaxID=267818 RepID=A0AAX3UE55_9LACO|nr:insulinase family protein [Lactobacillus kefiranofaciens]AEG40684.1 Zn-dependent peptidase [Lactobacillus kefiranofaciens subsp. kefiranofaciens]KRL24782.1 Zn-dependent peptidase [Lactobacillus kefiranofaciens subsp. kefirgranum DSM 10550 = JCM 8572]KRM22715.1 Zn-dependent peptidase [Lactobacillus kefiranofaciens subsp. kefiranofaciens DSM 5016 = JCM 6985]MCJ2171889.1 insulinase family protein [Lactobacillus kefiranofaciens]MCP9330778.1 insulinase family protein [Lactobacillus kefiranofacie
MLTTNIAIRKNKKFTTGTIGYFVRFPLTSHNLAFASLLARMQMNLSLSYPSIASQQRALSQLYDLQFEVMPQLFGKEIILTYYANFVEPIEILDPDYTYEKIIGTLGRIIRFPNNQPAALNLAQRQLKDDYRELMGQPFNYALDRFFKFWYQDQPDYAENFMGPIAEIKSADHKQMEDFISSLRQQPVAILGMGRDNTLLTKLAQKEFRGAGVIGQFQVDDMTIPAKRSLIDQVDQQGNIQAQVMLGFEFKDRTTYQDQIAGTLLEQYLAGDESSKLFSQIRAELGAAYDVSASSFANNSLFLINTGIDPQKVGLVKQIILNEMGKIANGDVDEVIFKKAKKAVQRNHWIGSDSQNWQLGQALRAELLPEYVNFDREDAIKKSTPHQMVNFARNLFFNESYILK